MNAIVLPAGTTHVSLDELEELIADALFPYTGPDDARLRAGYALANIGDELDMEAKAGKLLLRDGLTLGPYQVRMGEKIVNALVAVDDLRDYVGRHRKLTVIVDAPESAAPPVVAETPAMPVVAENASGGAEPIEAGQVAKGWVMKRAALVKKHVGRWPTIERDLRDSSENGLSKAAKAPGHGEWFEAAALDWARQRAKLADEKQVGPANSVFGLAGTQHKIKG